MKFKFRRGKIEFTSRKRETFNYDVTELEDYVDEQSPEIMADLINAANLKSRISVLTDVKGSQLIKLKESNPTLQGAAGS